MRYDLEERTAKFGENIILLCRSFKEDNITQPIINQLVRLATSIGANYMEANQASSPKDFKNKIRIAQKESNETKHWLRMLALLAAEDKKKVMRSLWLEAHELTLIFSSITRKI